MEERKSYAFAGRTISSPHVYDEQVRRPNKQNQSVIKGGLYEAKQAEQETGGPSRKHREGEHEWIAP